MNFDDIFRKFWDSKQNSIFFNTFQSALHKKLNSEYQAYYNSELLKNKRVGIQETNKQIIPIYQNFDENKFNFQKIDLSEVLFAFKHEIQLVYDYDITSDNFKQFDHVIIVNKSPVCQYHSLIIPFVHEKLPQRIDSDALFIVLKIMNLWKNQKKNLRVGFNSLGAFSSVNHLHFHSVFAEDLFKFDKVFPIEKSKKKLFGRFEFQSPFAKNHVFKININILNEYPVRCLMIEAIEEIPEEDFANFMSDVIGYITFFLLENNIAHNLMIANLGKVFYVIPRKNEGINERKNDFKCAWLEVCGLAICRNEGVFQELGTEEYENFLKENLDIEEGLFGEWLLYIKEIFDFLRI